MMKKFPQELYMSRYIRTAGMPDIFYFAWSGMNTLTEICSEYSEWTMTGFKYYIWGYISHSPCSWLNHGLSQTFSAKP